MRCFLSSARFTCSAETKRSSRSVKSGCLPLGFRTTGKLSGMIGFATAAAVANPIIPDNLPVVLNPKGKHPDFTLREDRFVSAEQVKRALDKKQRIVLLDARPPSDWIQFRIPGAISFP